ncbi:MAG: lecithin retinol acyltransferase family protein [Sarcina sp.]
MKFLKKSVGNFLDKIGNGTKPTISKIKEISNNRREIENTCMNINPRYGEIIKKVNNFTDTAKNGTEATIYGLIRHLNNEEFCYNIGEHLYVQRRFYTHHGIYVGNGRVVHYLKEKVSETSLSQFACGKKIFTKNESQSPRHHRKRDAVKRAYSRLGESKYNLAINNCDSFVRWCRNGI